VLGLRGELELATTDLLQRIGAGGSLSTAVRGSTRAQFESAELLRGQRRPGERIVLALAREVPAQAGEFAGGRDDRDLHAAPGAHALEKRPERPRDPGCAPGGFDEHPACVRATLLGDPPVRGGQTAGLAHPGVQAEIADQLPRAGEASEVTDRRDDRQCDGRVDTGIVIRRFTSSLASAIWLSCASMIASS